MRLLLVVALFLLGPSAGWAYDLFNLNQPGQIILMRHALAPGTGDPAHFKLRDCSTQRNLNDTGRDDARRIGDTLRAAGLAEAEVLSSQWCRCLETARLLDYDSVTEFTGLNSFFRRPDRDRKRVLTELRNYLTKRPVDAPTAILVTHQVVITAMTGIFPQSGEAVVLKLNGTSAPEIIGRFEAF